MAVFQLREERMPYEREIERGDMQTEREREREREAAMGFQVRETRSILRQENDGFSFL